MDLVEKRLDKIYDDKIDENISVEYYQRRFKEYDTERKNILKELNGAQGTIANYYEVGADIHELAFNAQRLYDGTKASSEEKRVLLNKIFSSMELQDKKLSVQYTPAYEFLAECIPKLNTTSELLKNSEYYRKTGSFEPAYPMMLGGRDSNSDSQDQNLKSYH